MNPLLRMAVQAGSEKAVSLHLNKISDIDEVDDKGMTLLMLAAVRGHSETCRILLESGATPLLYNLDGLSAQCLAQANGHTETVSMICRFIVNVSAEPENYYESSNNESLYPDSHIEPNDSDSVSFDGWDEEPESVIPENDLSLFSQAGDVQYLISAHTPEDLDEDWMDIHIELPEFTWAHAKGYLLHDFLQAEKNLFLHGINSGRLVTWQIDAMAELVEDEADGYAENLQEVLNDLGIRIDRLSCDYVHPCCLEDLNQEDEDPEVQLAEEAIRFLWEKNNPAHDPYWIFMRDVRSFQLLTASEEIDLGRMADEGSREILHAATFFPPAISELIAIVKAGGFNIVAGTSAQNQHDDFSLDDGGSDDDFVEDQELCNSDAFVVPDHYREQQQAELVHRIETVSILLGEIIKSCDFGNRDSDECVKNLQRIHEELAETRFSTEVLLQLVEVMHRHRKTIQDSVDKIRMLCTSIGGISDDTFHRLFCGNETNLDWCRNVMDGQEVMMAATIAIHSSEILDEQLRLHELEKIICRPLTEFTKLFIKLQSGEKKLRHAHYHMTVSNLRLAHHIAKRYQNSGLPLLDLVQEANIGLIKAVDRFDYRRGFRFSTFATWWIRQAVTRAIADKSRSIRIPVHVIDSLAKVKRAVHELQTMGVDDATAEDISQLAELPLGKVLKILDLPADPQSLDALEEEFPGFIETLPELDDLDPESETLDMMSSETIANVLSTLTPKEEKIIRMRFGIGEEKDYTLEEIGHDFNVTRERIRQIEAIAFKKLRHPSRSTKLKACFI